MPPPPQRVNEIAVRALPRPPRVPRSWLVGTAALALLLGAVGGVAGYGVLDALNKNSSDLPPIPAAQVVADHGTVGAVAEAVLPSVVSIDAINGGVVIASGSGFVISADGYILTNNHVIEPSDGEVHVVYSDGEEETAQIVGRTEDYDMAVLRVKRKGLVPLVLADSSKIQVGDPVIAIGSPLGLDATVTTGIVSSVHRPLGGYSGKAFVDAIQTDAAINPGNSGGPLLNFKGEVIGVNSAVAALPGATETTGAGSVGLGFAIPSNQARRTSDEIIKTGKATYPVVGVLLDETYIGEGVRVIDDDLANGVRAVSVGGPADKAGFQAGDVILSIEGRPVTRPVELIVALRAYAPGDSVTLRVRHPDGTEADLTMVLAANTDVTYEDGSDQVRPDAQPVAFG